MNYEGAVYRPPSEARSLIIQVTIGCSHNQCTFCSMYKEKSFRVKPLEEILKELKEASRVYKDVKRIFLADGNALVLKTETLVSILEAINRLFPSCERIGIYAAPKDILRKSEDELKLLHEKGLAIAYMGIESGSDLILKNVKKGVTSKEMILAGQKIRQSGIHLSVMIISGLGGANLIREHALESARVVNAIGPNYLALLTLLIDEKAELSTAIKEGTFKLLKPKEVLEETQIFVEHLELEDCMFRANHASNYLVLGGHLPQDKTRLLKEIEKGLEDQYGLKDEFYRRL